MARLTAEDLAQLVSWFEAVELPAPPFRSAPWAVIHEPEEWGAVILRDLHHGIAGAYWYTALAGVRWLAKRIGPPDVQAAAHVDQLAEQQGPAF